MTGLSKNNLTRSGTRAQRTTIGHLARASVVALAACAAWALPSSAFAQTDRWEVEVAPLYLWVATIDGQVMVNSNGVPIHVDFADAAKKLAGAFALHGEARHGRWGIVSDINFIRLSTDLSATTPILARPVTAAAKIDTVIFAGGVSYLVLPTANFNVVGGVRSYTLSPQLDFTGAASVLRPIDVGRTAVAAFGGFTYRPKLSAKVYLLSGADLGGGQAFSWSATAGIEYRFKPWAGVMAGYHALGIDTGNVSASGPIVNEVGYDVTQYGPVFSLAFRWRQK